MINRYIKFWIKKENKLQSKQAKVAHVGNSMYVEDHKGKVYCLNNTEFFDTYPNVKITYECYEDE